MIRGLLEGGERIGWGAKTIPEGGLLAAAQRLSLPGAVICGDSAGLVNVPKLKGIHYAMRLGHAGGRRDLRAAPRRARRSPSRARWKGYDRRVRSSHIWSDLHRVRNMRQALGKGMFVGAPDRRHDGHHARRPARRLVEVPRRRRGRGRVRLARTYPAPDGKLTFDKLSKRLPLGQPQP